MKALKTNNASKQSRARGRSVVCSSAWLCELEAALQHVRNLRWALAEKLGHVGKATAWKLECRLRKMLREGRGRSHNDKHSDTAR